MAYSLDGNCTNLAESYFARLRRSEYGVHHRILGHLGQYAAEIAWREDNRHLSNGEQFEKIAALAIHHAQSSRMARLLATERAMSDHVISGLLKRRSELAGRAEEMQRQFRQLLDDIDNLDATCAFFNRT